MMKIKSLWMVLVFSVFTVGLTANAKEERDQSLDASHIAQLLPSIKTYISGRQYEFATAVVEIIIKNPKGITDSSQRVAVYSLGFEGYCQAGNKAKANKFYSDLNSPSLANIEPAAGVTKPKKNCS